MPVFFSNTTWMSGSSALTASSSTAMMESSLSCQMVIVTAPVFLDCVSLLAAHPESSTSMPANSKHRILRIGYTS